jgi:hypothetical protein
MSFWDFSNKLCSKAFTASDILDSQEENFGKLQMLPGGIRNFLPQTF